MHMIIRIAIGLVGLAWLAASIVLYGQTPYDPELPTTVIAAIAALGYGSATIFGTNKITAIAGKILIVASLISLITLLLANGFGQLHIDVVARTLALVSGLFLERISPHQKFYDWMFLAIATKVQFVLIATLLASISLVQPTFLPLESWWAIVAFMILAIPFLALQKKKYYRFLILTTTAIALVLALDIITLQDGFTAITMLALSAASWPIITERLIGYRVFIRHR